MMLASCSNDETVELSKENAISFRSIVSANTRGVVADATNLNTLCVTAYQGTNLFFDNVIFQKDGTGFFNSAKPYYWPETGELTFTVLSGNWSGTRDFTSLTNQWMHDVAIADEIAEQQDMTYVSNVTGTKADNGKVGVPLEMKHALAQIQISAKNENKNYVYKVKGIRIYGVLGKGDFDFKDEKCWDNGEYKCYETTYDTPIDLTETAQSIMGKAGNAIVLPFNTLNAWDGNKLPGSFEVPLSLNPGQQGSVTGSYISVLVSITTNAGTGVYPKNTTEAAPTYGWAAVPVKFEWAKGNKYIYTLDFTKGAGKVDPVNPNENGKDDVKPGEPVKDPNKTEPILGDEIKFEVTVKEWTDISSDKPMNE